MINEYPFHFTTKDGTNVTVYFIEPDTYNFECHPPNKKYFEFNWKTQSATKRTAIGFGDMSDVMEILREFWAHMES